MKAKIEKNNKHHYKKIYLTRAIPAILFLLAFTLGACEAMTQSENGNEKENLNDTQKITTPANATIHYPSSELGKQLFLLKEIPQEQNMALYLFNWLMDEAALMNDDSILEALALANNWIYSLASEEVQEEIKNDMLRHLSFYEKIVSWQASQNLKLRLREMDVYQKFIWAFRSRSLPLSQKSLNMEEYRFFIESIESYEYLHQKAIELRLTDTNFINRMSKDLELWVQLNLNSSLETAHALEITDDSPINKDNFVKEGDKSLLDFRDKLRDDDHISWLNFQVDLIRDYGFTIGDCTTTSNAIRGFYKAMGIPAWIIHIHTLDKTKDFVSHFFVAHYQKARSKWFFSQQKLAEEPQSLGIQASRPVWHHANLAASSTLYIETESDRYNFFIRNGIPDDQFKKMLFSADNNIQGTAVLLDPIDIVDTDKDGITDSEETELGTALGIPDSDGDGMSDLWELDHGTDPLNGDDLPGIPIIDGIGSLSIDNPSIDNPLMENQITIFDPDNDSNAVKDNYDIKSFSFALRNQELLASASFYGDISQNVFTRSKIEIIGYNTKENSFHPYSILSREDPRAYVISSLELWDLEQEKTGFLRLPGMQQAYHSAEEFLIPWHPFEKYDIVFLRYFKRGYLEKGYFSEFLSP